jgi:hypothetical protein
MTTNKNLINAKPAAWDVTNKYLDIKSRDRDAKQLKVLRKLDSGKPKREMLTVLHNGLQTEYKIGKNNEYYDSKGVSITSALELAASLGNSQIQII